MKTIVKVIGFLLYLVFLMATASFVGTLLTMPSTIANILGIFIIIGIIFITYYIYKLVHKTFE